MMSSDECLWMEDRNGKKIQIIVSRPSEKKSSTVDANYTDDTLNESDAEDMEKMRALSLPNLYEELQYVGYYFRKWRSFAEKRRSFDQMEMLARPRNSFSLSQISLGFQKRNSILEDSFMSEYKIKKSTSP